MYFLANFYFFIARCYVKKCYYGSNGILGLHFCVYLLLFYFEDLLFDSQFGLFGEIMLTLQPKYYLFITITLSS